MRQIIDDFRVDPYKSISTVAIGSPELNAKQAQDHQAWMRNQYAQSAHRWCTKNAGFNLSKATISETEERSFSNCLNKYQASFGIFTQEKSRFQQTAAELVKNGEDRFAHLNH